MSIKHLPQVIENYRKYKKYTQDTPKQDPFRYYQDPQMLNECGRDFNVNNSERCCAKCYTSQTQCRRRAKKGSKWCWQHARWCHNLYTHNLGYKNEKIAQSVKENIISNYVNENKKKRFWSVLMNDFVTLLLEIRLREMVNDHCFTRKACSGHETDEKAIKSYNNHNFWLEALKITRQWWINALSPFLGKSFLEFMSRKTIKTLALMRDEIGIEKWISNFFTNESSEKYTKGLVNEILSHHTQKKQAKKQLFLDTLMKGNIRLFVKKLT